MISYNINKIYIITKYIITKLRNKACISIKALNTFILEIMRIPLARGRK